MCELMGIPSSRVSEYNKGKKPVSEEAIDALIRVSVEHDKQIYREYLYGNSDIMLLSNVTDEDIAEAEMRKNNPDYDVMQQRRKETEQQLDAQLNHQPAAIDPSSAANAAIAAYVELTNRLKQEMADRLADKDAIIQEKQARIVTLEATIKDKDTIILNLQRELAAANMSDVSRYPFTIGAAEDNKHPNM